MRYRLLILTLLACLLCGAALADQDFTFSGHRFSVFEGETLQIELLRQGVTADNDVSWTSSNQKVATVDSNGLVTAKTKGTVTIAAQVRANNRNYRTTATVNVLRAVTGLTVNENSLTVRQPDDISLEGLLMLNLENPDDPENPLIPEEPVLVLTVGTDVTLNVTMTPRDASSTRSVVSADDDGELLRISGRTISPKAPGECMLTVASEQNPEVSVRYHVLVIQRVRGVSVRLDTNTIGVGGMAQATAVIQPDNATVQAVEWSTSTPRIIAVSADGVITALSKGTGRVRATAVDGSRRYGEATITVAQMPTAITLSRGGTTVAVGKSITFTATVSPSNANNKNVTWSSSDPGVATVNASGRVTGVSRGTCAIICTSQAAPTVMAVQEITVTQPVERITPSQTRVSVRVGESIELGWSVTPANANDQSVSFSSASNRIATVNGSGMVTGVSKGETTITISANDGSGRSARVTVTVEQPVTGLTLRQTSVSVVTGRYTTLTATVSPANANNKRVTWTTTDPAIATVNNSGKVTGVKAGTAVITCASQDNPEISAICTVTVVQLVTSITLTPSSVELNVGESASLQWNVLPYDATDKTVTLRSSNTSVATVDPDGTIHARSRGECNITCAANDGSQKSARVHVVVIQPVEGVHMRNDQVTVDVDERVTIQAELEPTNANNNRMTWTSADPRIATVSGTTNRPSVTGRAWGSTTVTGVTEDGGFSTVCYIRVGTYAKALEITDLYLQNNRIKMAVKNLSNMNITRFYFTVQVYDIYDNPLPCTTNGLSYFTGYYLDELGEGLTTTHGRFHFDDFVQPEQQIGTVVFTLTGYRCDDGFAYSYKVDEQPKVTLQSEFRVGPAIPETETENE